MITIEELDQALADVCRDRDAIAADRAAAMDEVERLRECLDVSQPLNELLERLAEGARVSGEEVDAAVGSVATFDSGSPVLGGVGGEELHRVRLEVACVAADALTPQARLREYRRRAEQAEAEVERLRAALAEALATIDNERGAGDGPAEGWRWNGLAARWELDVGGRLVATVTRYAKTAWTAEVTPFHMPGVHAPTARAAMRAASDALKGGT